MESKYDEPLQQIMGLVVGKTPKSKILEKARELKIEITKAWSDAQQAISFLDIMISRYAPDEEWQQGFWLPTQQTSQRVIFQTGFPPPRPKPVSMVTRPERILEVARRVTTDGTVNTKSIIDQLRADGDQRPETSLAVSVGNVLTRHGWQRIGLGTYKLKEEQKGKEDTKALP
jgi:hypothetical protein